MSSLNELDQKIKKFAKIIEEPEDKASTAIESVKNPAAQLGIELAASLVVGVLLGLVLDNYLHTKPLFIILGVFVGIGAGAYNFYRILKGAGLAGLYPPLSSPGISAKETPIQEHDPEHKE